MQEAEKQQVQPRGKPESKPSQTHMHHPHPRCLIHGHSTADGLTATHLNDATSHSMHMFGRSNGLLDLYS